MTQRPRIMISSTFYDLKQVRAGLVNFLVDDLGFEPLVSEASSFPVEPDLDTIENCKRRVEQDADLLVLIVGGRYGFVDAASTKSITNLEYLAARAKGKDGRLAFRSLGMGLGSTITCQGLEK